MKLQDLKSELSNEKQFTENGAVGYRTTGKELLDLNFAASSLRKMSEDEIYNRFIKAFYENKLLAVKWLYFLRDCRGGMGERRSFRAILQRLAKDQPKLVKELIPITAEYGRFDDLLCLLDTDLKDDIISYYEVEIGADTINKSLGKSISLLAKWLPSIGGKNDRYAKMIVEGLGITQKEYSKMLKALRNYSNVIECKMSRNEWDKINYPAVPSKANLLYKDAFMRHDQERRKAYLDSLVKGEVKINAGTLFVHDIVHKYTNRSGWHLSSNKLDVVLEELWKALPDLSELEEETIVVRDDSGSMCCCVDQKSKVTAIEIATALAVYFSQYLKGEFKDKYISFSQKPKFIDMSNCNSLKEKLDVSYAHSEVANTNIEAVFDLILSVAIKNGYTQDELPKNILILSDMEFDSCAIDNNSCSSGSWYYRSGIRSTLFDEIAKKYAAYGYVLPRLVFWNIAGRTNTIPVKENEHGVALVSGFSQSILNMIIKGSTNPYQNLVDTLNVPRYDAVENAFNKSLD